MTEHVNHLGQPIGFPVPSWTKRPLPPRTPMAGRFCRVEPLDPERHAHDLHAANSDDREGRMWTYLPHGPYAGFEDYFAQLMAASHDDRRLAHAIIECGSGKPAGVASYLNINPSAGSIEIGAIAYAPRLQRQAAATEAMYLMMRRVFDGLGYRRYDWKCNALNMASCSAAKRLGFQFEGVFRQADTVKGRNRDTAWFSITD